MNTIVCRVKWPVTNLIRIWSELDKYYAESPPVLVSSKRFGNPNFTKVEWELCVEMKPYTSTFAIYLRQLGPNSINGLVNTQYEIFVVEDNIKRVLSRSTNKFENQEKLGYANVYKIRGKILRHDLSIQCKVSVDWYDAIDNLKFTYRNMLEEELFSDCVIKVLEI
ncbi:unnamed protein product [Meloidogyne enterolobii]|uniref:Uncharacterized protein n=1 Tax=Meloidogyne enterolobii TaxID=390850 RepID=A0ACB1AJP8_MELEN